MSKALIAYLTVSVGIFIAMINTDHRTEIWPWLFFGYLAWQVLCAAILFSMAVYDDDF